MRLIGYVIIAVGLPLGLLGALSAYSPTIGNHLTGLTLNADAGAERTRTGEFRTDGAGRRIPLAKKGETLTTERIAALRESGERRLRVKEFSLQRWSGAWLFLLGCIGLVGGAALLRSGRRIAEGAPESADAIGSAELALNSIVATLERLERELERLPADAKSVRTLEVVGALQQDAVAAVVDARARLVAERGLTEYARFMDAFAAGERKLNRAWSAAADRYEDEVRACIADALERFRQARDRFSPASAAPG